jgi:tRNA-dihydrouridine synthase A
VINGGFKTLAQVENQLGALDGVMIGREAYTNPWLLADVDRRIFGDPSPPPTRAAVVAGMLPYITEAVGQGTPVNRVTRHMLGLFQGQPRARTWRRHLSEHAHCAGASTEVVEQALELVS